MLGGAYPGGVATRGGSWPGGCAVDCGPAQTVSRPAQGASRRSARVERPGDGLA